MKLMMLVLRHWVLVMLRILYDRRRHSIDDDFGIMCLLSDNEYIRLLGICHKTVGQIIRRES